MVVRPSYLYDKSAPRSRLIKPDQIDSWIKDQIEMSLFSIVLGLHLRKFVTIGTDT